MDSAPKTWRHEVKAIIATMFLILPSAFAQQPGTTSPPPAILSQSIAAMVPSGTSLSDITLQGNVEDTEYGTDVTGTITLKGTQDGSIRMDLSLPTGTRSESVVFANGQRSGQQSDASGNITLMALHNLFVDSAWFSPVFLVQHFSSSWSVTDLGPVTKDGLSLDRLECIKPGTSGDAKIDRAIQRLSKMHLLMDPSTAYPTFLLYDIHPENNSLTTNKRVAIKYADYQTMGGLIVPSHIQKLVNGVVFLDIHITSVAINTGLISSQFALQPAN